MKKDVESGCKILGEIEKVHLDDLDLYVVTSAVIVTSVFL